MEILNLTGEDLRYRNGDQVYLFPAAEDLVLGQLNLGPGGSVVTTEGIDLEAQWVTSLSLNPQALAYIAEREVVIVAIDVANDVVRGLLPWSSTMVLVPREPKQGEDGILEVTRFFRFR